MKKATFTIILISLLILNVKQQSMLCLAEVSGGIKRLASEELSFNSIKYSTLKESVQIKTNLDKSSSFYDSVEDGITIQKGTEMSMQKYQEFQSLVGIHMNKGDPNFRRLESLTGGLKGCVSKETQDSSVYLLDIYTIPIEEYLNNLKSEKNIEKKIRGFNNIGAYFKGILILTIRLFMKDKNYDDVEIIGSKSFFVKKFAKGEFGVHIEDAGVREQPIDPNTIVIRRSQNIAARISQDVIDDLNKKFKINQDVNFSEANYKNLDMFLIFYYFIDYIKENAYDISFDVKQCFQNRDGINLYEFNTCPVFILQIMDIIPVENFKAIKNLILHFDYDVDFKLVSETFMYIFDYVESWNKGSFDIKKIILEVEPKLEPEEPAPKIILEEEFLSIFGYSWLLYVFFLL